MASYETNLKQMKKEFQDKAWERSEEDIEALSIEEFWSERDHNQLSHINSLMGQTLQYLQSMKYEMDNHFTEFDWVKIYGDLILE